jgi:predicted nuclease of restriction endonuclease-like (RecB) superfamily
MSNNINLDTDYKKWISELKNRVRTTQIKAAIAINSELIKFYWDLGRMISEKQTVWGSSFLEQLSKDLKSEFSDMKGFSKTNLYNIRNFYTFYSQNEFFHQLGGNLLNDYLVKIPWRHHIEIISKIKSPNEAFFYVQKTIENNWSRDVLALQIKSGLHKRQGVAITNFNNTLPAPQSDLAQQTIKDPYIFDFLTLADDYKEKDIENQLISHIRKFLLELGKGFAFIGQQYNLEIADNNYYIDLLFYHIKLKCYVVIELKNSKFIPEYAGKLNFYLSAVDTLLKNNNDNPTIGILLCRNKNNIEAEFALRDINKPIGVSEFQLTGILPDNLKSSLPTIEEIEELIKK